MKLIHLTDTHLVEPGQILYGLNPLERLNLAVASINSLHADADQVVITGDLTHLGQLGAYHALHESLAALKPAYTLILGNHDNRELFRSVFSDALEDKNGFVQGVQETAVGQFLFLDTNQPGTHSGWYCANRLHWLSEQLKRSGDTPKYIFMHHPPFDVALEPMDRIGLVQRDEFLQVLSPYLGYVRHLFFGHVHRPISGSWHGVPFSTLRGTNHQVWLDFEAKGDIPGSHEPPAYGVVLMNGDTVLVHTHDFLDQSLKFSLGGQMPQAS